MTGTTAQDDLDLRTLIKIILRHRWLLALGSVLGAALGLVVAVMTKEIYQANAIIAFDSNRPNNNQLSKPAKEIAESAHILEMVADTLNVKLESLTERFTARSADNQLFLRTLADTRELAGEMAKTWAAIVAQEESAQSNAIVQMQRDTISKIVDTVRKELQESQEKRLKFIKENDAFEKLEDYPVFHDYRIVQSDRDDRVTELNRLTAEQQLYTRPDVTPSELLNSERARHDEALDSYRMQLDALDAERQALAKTDADGLLRIDERHAAVRAAMLNEARKYAVQVRLDIDRVKSIIDQYDQKTQQMLKDMAKARVDHQVYFGLENNRSRAEKRYSEAMQRLDEFELNCGAVICTVVDDGTKNTVIFKRKEYKKYTIIGMVAGLFVALMFVGLLEVLREDA